MTEPAKHEKYLEIVIPNKDQPLKFEPTELENDGKMPDEAIDDNWDKLKKLLREELKLNKKSRFILVRADNIEDQIEDGGELQELWNELISSKSTNSYQLEMLCLLIEKEKEAVAWHPKGANHPKFGGNLEEQNWEKCFNDLKKFINIPEDEWLESIKDEDNSITIKKYQHLKKIWSDRYKKEEPRSVQFKVKSGNNDNDSSSDNDRKNTKNSRKNNETKSKDSSEDTDEKEKDNNKKDKKKDQEKNDDKKKDKKSEEEDTKSDDSTNSDDNDKKNKKNKKKDKNKKKNKNSDNDTNSDNNNRNKKNKRKSKNSDNDTSSDDDKITRKSGRKDKKNVQKKKKNKNSSDDANSTSSNDDSDSSATPKKRNRKREKYKKKRKEKEDRKRRKKKRREVSTSEDSDSDSDEDHAKKKKNRVKKQRRDSGDSEIKKDKIKKDGIERKEEWKTVKKKPKVIGQKKNRLDTETESLNKADKDRQNIQARIEEAVQHVQICQSIDFDKHPKEKDVKSKAETVANGIEKSIEEMYTTYGRLLIGYHAADRIMTMKPAMDTSLLIHRKKMEHMSEKEKKEYEKELLKKEEEFKKWEEAKQCEELWKSLTESCQVVRAQLASIIKMGAEFRSSLALVRSGIIDFMDRCQSGEQTASAMQGLRIQLERFYGFKKNFKTFADKAEIQVEAAVKKTIEQGLGYKQLKDIVELIREEDEQLKKVREEKEMIQSEIITEDDQKVFQIMKDLGELEGERDAIEFQIQNAQKAITNQNDVIKWAEEKKKEYRKNAESTLMLAIGNRSRYWWWWLTAEEILKSYQEILNIEEKEWTKQLSIMKDQQEASENKKNDIEQDLAESKKRLGVLKGEIDAKKLELKQIQDQFAKESKIRAARIESHENKIKEIQKKIEKFKGLISSTENSTGISLRGFDEFMVCYKELDKGLEQTRSCITNVNGGIEAMSGWFEMTFSTTVNLETVLGNLKDLSPELKAIGIDSPIYLCMENEKDFEEMLAPKLKNIPDIKLKTLKRFCLKLKSETIEQMDKDREVKTKELAISNCQPLRLYFQRLQEGMQNAQKAIEYDM